MSPSDAPARGTELLTFGGPDAVAQEAGGARAALQVRPAAPRPHDSRRSTAHRARQRRRAARRRSRMRMRDGSEALLVFLLLVGLTIAMVDLQTGGTAFDGARGAMTSAVGPMQTALHRAVAGPGPDEELVEQNQRLRAQAATAAADRARVRELERLLGVTNAATGAELVAASVVAGGSGSAASATVTIDRGTAAGVRAGQPVLAGGGLAGRVLRASQTTAIVQLAYDASFVVGGQVTRSGEIGVVRGTGDPRRLRMELLDPLAGVGRGEGVATLGSGSAGPYPPGLELGTVVDPGGFGDPERELRLRPAADLTALTVVAVMVAPAARPGAPVEGAPVEGAP